MYENLNMELSAQFQRVICSFAELGPEACLYLLHSGCLHRFIKLILNKKPEQADKLLNSVPLYWFDNSEDKFIMRNQETLDAKVPI